MAAEKKDSKNGAAGKFFGPSYFVMALLIDKKSSYILKDWFQFLD